LANFGHLKLGNVKDDVTEQQIRELMAPYGGSIRRIDLHVKPNEASVFYKTADDALAAFNGFRMNPPVMGKTRLRVRLWSDDRSPAERDADTYQKFQHRQRGAHVDAENHEEDEDQQMTH